MAPLESVTPSPITNRPPLATSPQEMSLNFVDLSVITARPPALKRKSGHLPLTPLTTPKKLAFSPPLGGGGVGAGAGAGVGPGVGAGAGAGAGGAGAGGTGAGAAGGGVGCGGGGTASCVTV